MKRTTDKRQCGNCCYSRLITGVLHCIKDSPTRDLDTGAAKWPTVEHNDKCGSLREVNDLRGKGKPGCDPKIFNDRFGEYCKIHLTRGQFTKVDPEDFLWLSQDKWHCQVKPNSCYAKRSGRIGAKHKNIWMHREIMKTPKHLVCDHINRNGIDNRKRNLRNCTTRENLLNRGPKRGSVSKYKGVYWRKQRKKWSADIQRAGNYKHLGYFESEIAAAKAYDATAKRLDGEFAFLNLPDQ